jgi:hypothetical protein
VRKSSIKLDLRYFSLDFSGQMGIIILNDLTGAVSAALYQQGVPALQHLLDINKKSRCLR